MPKKTYIVLIFIALFLASKTNAQEFATDIATTFNLSESLEIGDIISFTGTDYIPSQKQYDQDIFGVIASETETPLVLHTIINGTPVIRNGEALINVTLISGSIEVGDYITSSEIPGKGQKANSAEGTILGRALEPFDGSNIAGTTPDGTGYGKIKASITTSFFQRRPEGSNALLNRVMAALLNDIGTGTSRVLRYILAAIITVIAFIFSFNSFGRNVTKGIEAIGRNPLAKKEIQVMIIINIVLITIVSVGAVILSLVIIRI